MERHVKRVKTVMGFLCVCVCDCTIGKRLFFERYRKAFVQSHKL